MNVNFNTFLLAVYLALNTFIGVKVYEQGQRLTRIEVILEQLQR